MNFAKPSVLSDSLKTTPDSVFSLTSALDTAAAIGMSPLAGWSGASEASAIAFIDGSVADYQTLVAGIAPGTEVHLLDSNQDAVTQITNTLLGRHNISSLHIVSHGEAGGLDFGNSKLNLSDLPEYAAQLQSWSKALTDNADILLYGCDVAQGELGKAFTSILSQLTGADVAASDDLTGNAAHGGNWEMEFNTGSIESFNIFSTQAKEAYEHVLATFTVANTADSGAGSLRQAVTDANGAAGADTINFALGAGAQTITLSSGLTLTDSVKILNTTGAANLTIQAPSGGAFIIFTVNSGATASFDQLTIRNGSVGIYNNNGTITAILNSALTNNSEAIDNFSLTGIDTIANSTISGGNLGIHSHGPINTIFNSTFSGIASYAIANDAGSIGTIANVTIAGNSSQGINNFSRTITTLANTIIANNGTNYLGNSPGTSTNNLIGGTFASVGLSSTLANNGGSTQTYAVLAGSPALNAGSNAALPLDTLDLDGDGNTTETIPFDQRGTGFVRIQGGTVDIGAVEGLANANPVVSLPGGSVSYTENTAAVVLDVTGTVTDSDSTDFDTGALTITYSANGTVDDRLAINNQGTGAGQIGVSGSNVSYGGTTIGTFTGGVGTTPLVVTFNSNSSPGAAEALLRNLTYSNVSDALSTIDRTLSVVLTDGDGGTSTTANKTISATAVNDAPTVTAPSAIAITEDTTTVLTGISFADVDAGSGTMSAVLSVGAGSLSATAGSGVTVLGSASPSITLNGTLTALNSFLTNSLTYTPALNDVATQTLGVRINDGGNTGSGGALSSGVTNVALNVTAVNDAPTVTAPTAIAVTEDITTALTGIAFADVDADSGIVTATLTVGAGTLAATAGSGVAVGGTATNLTLGGTLAAINSFIAGNSLTYTTAPNATATQTLGVSINDGGNTGSGGALSSAVTNVNLTVTPVNDAPSFTKGGNQTVTTGAGAQTITNWATGFNPGPADEASQTVQAYEIVNNDHAEIFTVAPAIDAFGNLTYTPASNLATATTAILSVRVQDNGGTTNGGIDTSTVQTFAITVKPQPTISITPVTQNEGNSSTTAYTFTVNMSDTSTQTVQVNYATADGTATVADGDYLAASNTLTFAPGETSKTFTVNVNGDTKYESTEAFTVSLSNAVNGTIAANSNSVNGTITNDDTAPVVNITSTITHAEGNSGTTPYNFTVNLSNPSFEAIGIDYSTSDGSATVADGDYTAATGTVNFAPGETSKTITVNAAGDTKFESDETFQVALTGPANGSGNVSPGNTTGSGTITNDDTQPTISIGNVSQNEGNSGTTAYTFTVNLSNASTQTVTVNYATADGTATIADSDYLATSGSLNFAPGQTSKTITVQVNGDTKFEADQAFSLALSNASNGTLGTSTGTGTIVNDDTRPTISINSVSNPEGRTGTTPFTFTVSLSNASDETVTVNYATADGTATSVNSDYAPTSGTLTFNPLESSKTIAVNVNGDIRIEPDETFRVNLTAPTKGTIATGTGTGTLRNDDNASLVWRNGTSGAAPTGTGENAIWQLNGFAFQSGSYLPSIADLNWQIVSSSADFNLDGNTDILWRNRATGANAIWELNNLTLQSAYYIPSVSDLNWQIVGTADFNRDSKPDLLWRNRMTGENAVWQLNGSSLQSSYYIPRIADQNWQIVGTGDFNNDGIADLVWHNQATTSNAIWQMNSTGLQSGYYLPTAADSNWQIVGTSDFNNDGIADLVWHNQVTGANAIWQMNSTGLQSGYYLPTAADINWQIAGITDFGGDSTPDMLWRNQQSNKNEIWQMSGFSYSQTYQLPDASQKWSVKPLPLVALPLA
ncbi:Calx-beta domain-containing protein [Stenomitos frigidus]|uniref:Calx-beta domain-containing protein n=1 Tax=Stenomitos frigidus ULC18 TaxID=2107698 RepID=A0A2T1EP07_9CYAN|nr:Calx-beta domain-containing protein [Stenomitos frigidus]PSB34445.1 hypothetical protein C7B82_03020 [Stenomitos frigidus ULC18]